MKFDVTPFYGDFTFKRELISAQLEFKNLLLLLVKKNLISNFVKK